MKVREQDQAHPAVHPLGSLTVRQHAVPLGQRVERCGPDLLQAACRYDITSATLAGQTAVHWYNTSKLMHRLSPRPPAEAEAGY